MQAPLSVRCMSSQGSITKSKNFPFFKPGDAGFFLELIKANYRRWLIVLAVKNHICLNCVNRKLIINDFFHDGM